MDFDALSDDLARPFGFLPLATLMAVLLLGISGCGDGSQKQGGSGGVSPAAEPAQAGDSARPARAAKKEPTTPDDLDTGLVLGLSVFPEAKPGDSGPPVPLPAELEFLVRRGGEWVVTKLTDDQSNVFHKAMAYETPSGETALLTGAGEKAMLRLWTKENGEFVPQTLWEKDFGGRFSRMRDIEVGDIDGDGTRAIAVATHDQGVVAVVRPEGEGYSVEELDLEKDTFVHEVELGDVDGDGVMEVYATPSEPNKLDGSHQSGVVVRYVPSKGEGRVVVADLGERHAKEILVHDIDGNGKDELYVIVEGQKDPGGRGLLHRTEIRRYEADTPPDEGVVIAELKLVLEAAHGYCADELMLSVAGTPCADGDTLEDCGGLEGEQLVVHLVDALLRAAMRHPCTRCNKTFENATKLKRQQRAHREQQRQHEAARLHHDPTPEQSCLAIRYLAGIAHLLRTRYGERHARDRHRREGRLLNENLNLNLNWKWPDKSPKITWSFCMATQLE